jgi:hypothetical protein
MYADIWKKLKDVINFGKNNTITTGGFDKKIIYDTVKFFGSNPQHPKDEDSLLDDEYKSTLPPEKIKVSNVKYIHQDVRYDVKVLQKLRGASFIQIDFEGDGYIKEFDTIKDLNSYMYSLINYINSGEEKSLMDQKITILEKHYFSNKLGFENSEKLYKIKVTKFLEKIVIEAEVAEMGIYYKISNYNGVTFCDCV